MNSDSIQIRLQLQCMRPNGQDQGDAACAAALSQVSSDPVLADWLAREQAFDQAFAASLASVRPPPALAATILAGAHASRRSSRWRRTAWLGLATAAAVVLFAGIIGLWLRPAPLSGDSLAEFRIGMIQALEVEQLLDHKTPQADDARVWLASHQGIADPAIPPGLCSRETIGCKVFEWQGSKVTLICFRPCPSGNPQSAPAHLFVIEEKDAPSLPAADSPLFSQWEAWTSAVWKKDGRVHLLVSRSAMPHLQSLFDG